MTKYLYGAAVQGIQSFIYQTNDLKDIVGASELVEEICTTAFKEDYGRTGEKVLQAAGNIKWIYDDRSECEKAVREFPRKVMTMAPGITISQAVVAFDDNGKMPVEELEQKLRAQRNKPFASITQGLMGIKRLPKTGMPATSFKDGELMDAGTEKKLFRIGDGEQRRKETTSELCKKAFGEPVSGRHIAYNVADLTQSNDWIAIIHADGNGLGQVVQKLGKDKDDFVKFSALLDKSCTEACINAFNDILKTYEYSDKKGTPKIPIRPVLLGGDDLTVICRGDIALDFTDSFMRHFEKETKKQLGGLLTKDGGVFEGGADHLTACAGIAFIKSSYPFYYGYELAESLCTAAKKEAKQKELVEANGGLAPSCLMFHKVQDSFTEDYKAIVQRELTPSDGVSWQFGPYCTDGKFAEEHGKWTTKKLLLNVGLLEGKEGNAVKSHLRRWMSAMHDGGPNVASQLIERLLDLLPKSQLSDMAENVTNEKKKNEVVVYPVYDILAIHSIMYQITKSEDNE